MSLPELWSSISFGSKLWGKGIGLNRGDVNQVISFQYEKYDKDEDKVLERLQTISNMMNSVSYPRLNSPYDGLVQETSLGITALGINLSVHTEQEGLASSLARKYLS